LLGKLRRQVRLSLQLKFGTLPEDVLQALEQASEERLDELAERLTEAHALQELLR
jgi:hypothetical protein